MAYGMYTCGRCGGVVDKSTRRCPHCSALLAGIRCTGCGFVGGEGDFPGDRCPKCGAAVRTGGASRQSAPAQEKCKGCGKLIKPSDWTCPHCGHTQWGMIVGLGIFALLCIGLSVLAFRRENWSDLVGWLAGILGAICLLVTIGETVTGLKTAKR